MNPHFKYYWSVSFNKAAVANLRTNATIRYTFGGETPFLSRETSNQWNTRANTPCYKPFIYRITRKSFREYMKDGTIPERYV